MKVNRNNLFVLLLAGGLTITGVSRADDAILDLPTEALEGNCWKLDLTQAWIKNVEKPKEFDNSSIMSSLLKETKENFLTDVLPTEFCIDTIHWDVVEKKAEIVFSSVKPPGELEHTAAIILDGASFGMTAEIQYPPGEEFKLNWFTKVQPESAEVVIVLKSEKQVQGDKLKLEALGFRGVRTETSVAIGFDRTKELASAPYVLVSSSDPD